MTDRLSLDVVFEILANQHRRYALSCLKRHETPLAVADLAEEVTARKKDTTVTDVSDEEVRRTYKSLYHSHIPMLDEAGIVDYDLDANVVTLTENDERLWKYMEILERTTL